MVRKAEPGESLNTETGQEAVGPVALRRMWPVNLFIKAILWKYSYMFVPEYMWQESK